MYAEVLGLPKNVTLKEFPSPFPPENKLNLIIAKTSTKYTARSDNQYKDIANILTDIINTTPGNSAIFFPSYYMKEKIDSYLNKVEKTVFHEIQNMATTEKEEMINRFRSYKKTGAALLAVVAGSFGEGIDLPGDELKTVVIVGLPLGRPDLETEALIQYYDAKFNRGWDYGYVLPAFNKIIQNAGRCIRSETDKGVVIFLDERFTWPRYYRCFPSDWKIKVSVDHYKEKIEKFFSNQDTATQHTLNF
jgi:DNA excision repair protein ERCC-2